jgi:UPF0271 protein
MKLSVDLNADLGEGSGHDAELFDLISSANIATGFHAGDSDTMHAAISAAKKQRVAVGAHPSFFDRENFGRKELTTPAEEVFDAVAYQLGIFQAIASALDVQPNHVKPHGALYNMAVRNANLADAIARAVESIDAKLILFAPDKSELARAGEAHGLQIAREIFADRNYLNDGWLVPRTRPDALLHDPKEAAERVLRMLREGKVQSIEGQDVEVRGETICVHGDTPGAVEFARELRTRLEREGVAIRPPKRAAGAGAPSHRNASSAARPEGGPSPRFRHLAHLPSFRDNPIVFFTVCTFQRRKILASAKCEEILREIWQRSAGHNGWWVGNYVVMPDHVHFFARPAVDARSKPEWVGMWKSVSARRIAATLSIKPPIWQPDYFDRYLRSSEGYSDKWQYVEQNPVRAGLVVSVEDWPYRGTINDLMF